jgi:hypothetical protein
VSVSFGRITQNSFPSGTHGPTMPLTGLGPLVTAVRGLRIARPEITTLIRALQWAPGEAEDRITSKSEGA